MKPTSKEYLIGLMKKRADRLKRDRFVLTSESKTCRSSGKMFAVNKINQELIQIVEVSREIRSL